MFWPYCGTLGALALDGTPPVPDRARILLVTDLAYQARGRRYCDEDILLGAKLREHFDIAMCHPLEATLLMDAFDLVMIRNSGPVLYYRQAWDTFRAEASRQGTRVYNPLHGRGDMAGKQYLLDLTSAGYPVIPTVERIEHLDRLPAAESYAVKPGDGADSIGLEFLARHQLSEATTGNRLIQPRIDFEYEVSFYFVDHEFQYALYAPDPQRRWDLEPYAQTRADLEFARRFVEWNTLEHGIQRIDACRTRDGDLLLVELEDLNPYLSLDRLSQDKQHRGLNAISASLRRVLSVTESPRPGR